MTFLHLYVTENFAIVKKFLAWNNFRGATSVHHKALINFYKFHIQKMWRTFVLYVHQNANNILKH